jgi:predicted lipoprotein with Yx(FWY)xxD motif
MVADGTQRRWQLTDAVAGAFVTFSDDQWLALMSACDEANRRGWPPVGA